MIHPSTELKHISPEWGFGVFATSEIPKGTIVYVKDPLEIEVDPQTFASLDPLLQEQVSHYSYIDENGMRIVSWDRAKYVNHCCDCNTMSTGYGFEIALRDIGPGEEITDEYGLFNITDPMDLSCGCDHCRGVLTPGDIDLYYETWDAEVRDALVQLESVPQPLWPLLDRRTIKAVRGYLQKKSPYRSVRTLKAPTQPHIIEIGVHQGIRMTYTQQRP